MNTNLIGLVRNLELGKNLNIKKMEFIKNNIEKIVILILSILVIVTGICYYFQSRELKEKNGLLYFNDSLYKVTQTAYKKVSEEVQLYNQMVSLLKKQNDSLSIIVDKNKETIVYLNKTILKYKNQTYTKIDSVIKFLVKDSIIYVPLGDDIVKIEEENSLYKIDGKTFLYPQKGYIINFIGKPFIIDIVLTEDRNGVFQTYVDTKNKDIELIDISAKVYRNIDDSWYKNFSMLTSFNVTNKNVFLDLGLLYGRYGIKGIVGYDYQDYIIEKRNLYYGAGVVYKLF